MKKVLTRLGVLAYVAILAAGVMVVKQSVKLEGHQPTNPGLPNASKPALPQALWPSRAAARSRLLKKIRPPIRRPWWPKFDKSPEMQARRKKFIQEAVYEEVFETVNMPGTVAMVCVKLRFYLLDFDTKQDYIAIVYAYYFDGREFDDCVAVWDRLDQKELATYSIMRGLKMK